MSQPNLSYAASSILLSVSHGYQYGFDIMDCTGLPSGTVYPALRRLEDAGFVVSRWEGGASALRDQRPARKYYEIAQAGEKALEAALRRFPLLERVALGFPRKALAGKTGD